MMSAEPRAGSNSLLDCLIVGGGPAGLTAALYLARFGRNFLLVDSGQSRAAWIPASHNFPVFSQGISGAEMLERQRGHLRNYGVQPQPGTVTGLQRQSHGFLATLQEPDGAQRQVPARHVLLATGSRDLEPDLPDLVGAVRRGLLRYCPICDGYEARGQKVAVIGFGARGLGEALFVARTYTPDVTLLTLGLPLTREERSRLEEHNIALIEEPVTALDMAGDRIVAVGRSGQRHDFQTLYSALGLDVRSGLARALGARHDEAGALITDDHNRTSLPGLYAAGDVARGLNQIVVAMGHAAIAATHIHNRCHLPTEDEPEDS
jgi:thioredoxin reductase (NADPH)